MIAEMKARAAISTSSRSPSRIDSSSSGMLTLHREPGQWDLLVRDPTEYAPRVVEEVLRYEPPFRGHYRHVRNDTTLAGVGLPADSRLLLLWGAANRDPAHFETPGEFRLDRSEVKGHFSFGKGAHFCVGAALARLEARMVLRLLLDRTSEIRATDVGRWLPSILVRRLERLELAVT